MDLKLVQTISEALEAEARRKGVTPEELLLDLLLEIVPEKDEPKPYLKRPRSFTLSR